LVTEKSGILGLGSGSEFHILVFDPADPSSQRAYAQAQQMASSKMGTTGAAAGTSPQVSATTPADSDDKDREYVRDPAQPAEPCQLKPDQKSAGDKASVSITGRLVERDGVQAIVITSVEAATANPQR
jgi:hypothetical protein